MIKLSPNEILNKKLKAKDFKTNYQYHIGDFTVDISKEIGCWSVAMFKNIGKHDEKLLNFMDEIKTKNAAVALFNKYVQIIILEYILNKGE